MIEGRGVMESARVGPSRGGLSLLFKEDAPGSASREATGPALLSAATIEFRSAPPLQP